MKFKLITIILLGLSLTACGEKSPQSTVAMKDGPWWERDKYCEKTYEEYPFDFQYTFEKTDGKQQFSRKITDEERDQFYIFMKDHTQSAIPGEQQRFNRKRIEQKFTPIERNKKEQKIKALLDECVTLVGPEPNDGNYGLKLQSGTFDLMTMHTDDKEYSERIQPIYLSGRMQKCERAIYPYPEPPTQCVWFYDLSDFEFQNQVKDQKMRTKKQMLEQKYEIIYLNIREAGLLRDIAYAYYPKSLLREHANKTGLTKYIKREEKKTTQKLKHDLLASEFFGSHEKWINSLDKFLDQKTITLNIGK